MQITFYGHACFSVKINQKNILFDPFITGNELSKHIDINKIEADYILLSHGHSDHVADVEIIAKRTGAKIVACYEVAEWFAQKGCNNYHTMNVGGQWHFDFGTVKCVSAVHSSSMPNGAYGGIAMGFVITSTQGNFYYSGDTALTLDMQLIPSFAQIDFAFLCIGDNFTMGVKDAIQAAKFVKTKKVYGVHYNTFGYIKINEKEAISLFLENDIELILNEN